MTFVHPFAWVLLALLAVPILLYLLPMPRRRVQLPSVILWQRMLKDRRASASLKWLRTLLSFLLEAVILVLLVLAVGRPVFSPAEGKGSARVIILDVSASMQAPLSVEGGRTRFELAREFARRIIDRLPSGHRAGLITAGATPVVVSGLTDQRTNLLRKLDALSCTDGVTSLTTALELALELARGEPGTDVYLLSDGRADVSDVTLGPVKLHYFRIGEDIPNVGIVEFQARRSFDYPDEYQALARVQNSGPAEQSATVWLTVDDNLVESRRLTIPAKTTLSESFTRSVHGLGRLTCGVTAGDAFAIDDTARVLLGPTTRTNVVLVTDVPNRFLESALTANRVITPYVATLSQFLEVNPPRDVLILNGVLPPDLPDGNLLIINPPATSPALVVTGEVKNPQVTDWRRDHPILARLTLKDVYIPSAGVVKPPVWVTTVLAQSEGTPLIFAGETPGRRIVVLTFDPGSSSIPFRVAFPVLIANAIGWLTQRGEPVTVTNLTDATESDLTVKSTLTLADASVDGRRWAGSGYGEFWLVAAVAALLLLGIEWYLYHHRIVV